MQTLLTAPFVLAPVCCLASVGSWIDACERELDCVHGFVLRQHGKVLAEGSWRPFDTLRRPHMLYSHSKSFTSSAVGFLVDDGELDLDERIVDILPDKVPEAPSEELRSLRIRDLLTMNVGASRNDSMNDDKDGDWERAFLANTLDGKPGQRFRYDSGATYLLASIVERRCGRRMMDFLKERMFDPIGIAGAWSTTSPSGTACGGWGMNMTTRDLSLFGQLYLQKGLWNGRRIISEEWVTLATARQTWSGAIAVAGEDGSDWHQGYGFQFWRCRFGFYRADGADGQLTVVMPQHDAVISVHAGLDDMQRELDLIWKHIVPMLAKGEPPSESDLKRCAALSIPPVTGASEGYEAFLGKKVPLRKDGGQGVKSLRLEADGNRLVCTFETPSGAYGIPVGRGKWLEGTIRFSPRAHEPILDIVGEQTTAASGAVQSDGTFKMRVFLLNAPHKIDLVFREAEGVLTASGTLKGLGGGAL